MARKVKRSTRRPSLGARGGAARRRGHTTRRPRFLRFRWWLLIRSPDSAKAALFVVAIALVVGFGVLRRSAPRPRVLAPPPAGAGGTSSGASATAPLQSAAPQP